MSLAHFDRRHKHIAWHSDKTRDERFHCFFIYLFNIKAKGPEGHLHCSTQYKYNSTRLLTWAILWWSNCH